MCGIAGEFIFDPRGRVDESIIVPMVSAIRHRGPDQWGYYLGCSGSVLLINTRLSIVDLSNRPSAALERGWLGLGSPEW